MVPLCWFSCSEECSIIESQQLQEVKTLTFDAFLKDSRTASNGYRFSGSVFGPILHIISFFLKRNVQPMTLQSTLVKIQELVKTVSQDEGAPLKVPLAEFLSSLSSFEFPEVVENPVSEALWYLYHTILREQHWALVHNGLKSFGYFAEHTPCNELWRFVPSDPGLASDVQDMTQSGADMFMDTLKSFLEKETLCASLIVSNTDVEFLHQDAKKQRTSYFQLLQIKEREIPEEKTIVVDLDSVDTTDTVDIRHRNPVELKGKSKPDEVKTAILMLQEGYSLLSKIPTDWLSSSDSKQAEWRSVISQLAAVNRKLASL